MIPTQQPPARRPRRYTEGATLIVVVLFTMLILSLIMIVTLRLTLSARTGGMDQKAILQSQYNAESNLALARSRLRDIQTVLSSIGPDGTTPFMTTPANVVMKLTSSSPAGTVSIDNLALQFCGRTSWPSVKDNTLDPAGTAVSAGKTRVCQADPNGLTNQKFAILSYIINSQGYAYLPTGSSLPAGSSLPPGDAVPSSTANIATKTAWWDKYLNYSNNGISYSVLPEKVVNLGAEYRFYFKPTNISTTSSASYTGKRITQATGQDNSDWWIDMNVPNFFDNALMVNSWQFADGGFQNDVIKGNIFTNDYIRFLNPRNRVQFLGDVNSAGCVNLTPTSSSCPTTSPGFYTNRDDFVTNDQFRPVNSSISTKFTNTGASVGGNMNFLAPFTKLPLTATTQLQDAQASGFVLPSGVDGITLYAGDNSTNQLSSYINSTSSWNESVTGSGGTFQYIQTLGYVYNTSSWTQVTVAVYNQYPASMRTTSRGNYYVHSRTLNPLSLYRYGSDNELYKQQSSSWVDTGTNFNGIIYSGTSSPLEVFGPSRLSGNAGDVSKMPPALASFARINITSVGGMNLNTDLTMSNTPCGFDNKWFTGTATVNQPACPKAVTPVNQLALFAPSGDITMSNSTQDEATYHAAILASQGTFNVQYYSTRDVQGNRHVVGAVVESHYGLNGTANSSGRLTSGYNDDFSQDIRLKDPSVIPSNPIQTEMNWIFSNASPTPGDAKYKNLSNIIWKQGTQ